jgi:hypothetical protein
VLAQILAGGLALEQAPPVVPPLATSADGEPAMPCFLACHSSSGAAAQQRSCVRIPESAYAAATLLPHPNVLGRNIWGLVSSMLLLLLQAHPQEAQRVVLAMLQRRFLGSLEQLGMRPTVHIVQVRLRLLVNSSQHLVRGGTPMCLGPPAPA